MTIDEIKKWMLESSGFPVTQANAEYLERFQAIAFQAGAASRDAEIAKLKSVPMKYRRMAFNAQLQDEVTRLEQENDELLAQIKQKDAEIAELQAHIDELMLEYCPNEMTKEQLEEWGRNQVAVPEDSLPEALAKVRKP